MYVIGLAGQAQNGKDTAADYLKEALNKKLNKEFWQRMAFARNVKRILSETFGVSMEFVEKWKTINENPPGFDMTMRKALQFIGDGFRQIQGSIWMDLMFRDKDTPKIISDVRYINELKAIKFHGGLVIVVARPGSLNDDPNGSEAQIRPLAEWALRNKEYAHLPVSSWKQNSNKENYVRLGEWLFVDPPEKEYVDYILINDGTIEELIKKVDEIIVPAVEKYFGLGE